MSESFPPALEKLIHEFSRLPTVGRKSAQRLALFLLKNPVQQANSLAGAINELHERVTFCQQCFYLAEGKLCGICQDLSRDEETICVVEEPTDVAVMERSGSFRGLYHVLMGRISPLQGVMPEDLKIAQLLKRLDAPGAKVREVVLAMNPDVDGDATALYLSRLLNDRGVKVTRVGFGLPMGGSLEFADELTIQKALESRRDF